MTVPIQSASRAAASYERNALSNVGIVLIDFMF